MGTNADVFEFTPRSNYKYTCVSVGYNHSLNCFVKEKYQTTNKKDKKMKNIFLINYNRNKPILCSVVNDYFYYDENQTVVKRDGTTETRPHIYFEINNIGYIPEELIQKYSTNKIDILVEEIYKDNILQKLDFTKKIDKNIQDEMSFIKSSAVFLRKYLTQNGLQEKPFEKYEYENKDTSDCCIG